MLGGGVTSKSETETSPVTESNQNEEDRLAERARRIWGDNPFSPENMAADAALKAEERRGIRAQERFRRMRDLEDD